MNSRVCTQIEQLLTSLNFSRFHALHSTLLEDRESLALFHQYFSIYL